eukprot:2098381-Amphidinium_carterae.1
MAHVCIGRVVACMIRCLNGISSTVKGSVLHVLRVCACLAFLSRKVLERDASTTGNLLMQAVLSHRRAPNYQRTK